MEQRARTINASSLERGEYLRGDQIETDTVEWLAWGVGRRVRQDLRLVHQLGGKRAHGAGYVREWVVEDAEIAPIDTWMDEQGRAARNLPAEAMASECHDHVAVEPPYWPSCMQVPGVRAGDRIDLRPDIKGRLAGAT